MVDVRQESFLNASVGTPRGSQHRRYTGPMNHLRAATKNVLKLVEERTDRPVQFLRDESLKVMASFQMARNGATSHILRYRPTDDPIDYLVVHQAAFALRLYENEPDQRFDFTGEDTAAKLMSTLIPGGRPLPASDAKLLPEFARFTAHWALMNLRSFPVGMRIDAWIDTSVPDLRDLQRATLEVQQQQNVASLSYRRGGMSLPRPTIGLVAAYALFVDRLCVSTCFAIPYKAAGMIEQGAELLQAWDTIDTSPTHDIELIDLWASLCGLSGHYDWIPFKP
jgi:hypothetical protein